jgi:hypothetical protein
VTPMDENYRWIEDLAISIPLVTGVDAEACERVAARFRGTRFDLSLDGAANALWHLQCDAHIRATSSWGDCNGTGGWAIGELLSQRGRGLIRYEWNHIDGDAPGYFAVSRDHAAWRRANPTGWSPDLLPAVLR